MTEPKKYYLHCFSFFLKLSLTQKVEFLTKLEKVDEWEYRLVDESFASHLAPVGNIFLLTSSATIDTVQAISEAKTKAKDKDIATLETLLVKLKNGGFAKEVYTATRPRSAGFPWWYKP
jgi:hypothetical protein